LARLMAVVGGRKRRAWTATGERQVVKMERQRTKENAPFSARMKARNTITQKVLAVKNNYVVIRMDVAEGHSGAQVGLWKGFARGEGFERIVEICGKVGHLKFREPRLME